MASQEDPLGGGVSLDAHNFSPNKLTLRVIAVFLFPLPVLSSYSSSSSLNAKAFILFNVKIKNILTSYPHVGTSFTF